MVLIFMVFDKEIVKKELKGCIEPDMNIDLDEVVENFIMIDGFYCFRIGIDGHLFSDNTYIDALPGYFITTEKVN